MRGLALLLLVACHSDESVLTTGSADASAPRAAHVRVTTLSTMMTDWPTLTGAPHGEWGYAALIEIDDKKILFDTGKDPSVILHNLDALGISLADVDTVVFSHRHSDHTGGLIALKQRFPSALDHIFVATGFVEKLEAERATPENELKPAILTEAYAAVAGSSAFQIVSAPTSLFDLPYVKITGPIPRRFEERDTQPAVPEDQALVIDTVEGLIVITGCGHAGVVNTLDAAQVMFPNRPIHAVIGGLHLYERTKSYGFASLREYLDVVAKRLRGAIVHEGQPATIATPVRYLVGSHCTGIESLYQLRAQVMDGDPRRAVVDTPATRFVVGAAFYNEQRRRRSLFNVDPTKDQLVEGINPVFLNRPIDWPAPEAD